jgi:hypothetical protein
VYFNVLALLLGTRGTLFGFVGLFGFLGSFEVGGGFSGFRDKEEFCA